MCFYSHNPGQVIISDNGQGVSGEELAMLMQPFYQAKNHTSDSEKGNGLGLSICRRIMENQGKMYIESEQGKYFRVILQYTCQYPPQ